MLRGEMLQAFAIASLALYPVAVNDGLGEHIEELDAQSVSQYFKVRQKLRATTGVDNADSFLALRQSTPLKL